MINKRNLGATLAAAAALTFVTAPVTSAFAAGDATAAQVQCFGVNACKGQSECKTPKNSCKGQNSCKGTGMMMMSADDCKTKGGTTEAPAAK